MATSWAEIDAAAMVQIDDVRLQEQLQISPALYYRRMAMFVEAAMPLLSRPPEFLAYLTQSMEKPEYDEFEWVSTDDSTDNETTVETGKTGYDICSCIAVEMQNDGRVMQTPYQVNYDAETGNVVFGAQDSAGIHYQLDFYKDGTFDDISTAQMRLFALAIALTWDERFAATWIDRTPKINDSSFSTVNEANWTEKISQAHRRKAQDFYEELKTYEQLCAYNTRVTGMGFAGVKLV